MKVLIAIPTKTAQYYSDRAVACAATWLKDCPCAYKLFSDHSLGLTEIDQHNNEVDPIRTWRTKLMVSHAYEHGYDFVFRVDADAYVWVNRLLASGFEKWDYVGYCNDVPDDGSHWCRRTAHGGLGFFLSRLAMKVIVDAPIEKYSDGKFWGDMWAGQQLHKAGISCHRETRFVDASLTPVPGIPVHIPAPGFTPAYLTPDHQWISIHPIGEIQSLYDIHAAFPQMSDKTVPVKR